jgi:hypothetical protein
MVKKKSLPKAEDIIAEFDNEAAAIASIFQTTDGKVAMGLLEELFYNGSSIVPGDPYQTHANEGAREVIITIKEIIRHANE